MAATATTFRVGDRVLYDGRQPATVWEPKVHDPDCSTTQDGEYLIRLDDGGGWRGGYGQGQRMWFALPGQLTPLAEPQEATQSDAQPTDGQSLQRAEIDALKAQIQAMQDDLAIIGEHLKRTAERHEWCGEYEEHLSRLVADLSEHSAKTLHDAAKRVQTYKVSRTLTHTIEACDAAQAERIANDRYGQADWTAEEVD